MLIPLTAGLEIMLILYHYIDTKGKNKGNLLPSIKLSPFLTTVSKTEESTFQKARLKITLYENISDIYSSVQCLTQYIKSPGT